MSCCERISDLKSKREQEGERNYYARANERGMFDIGLSAVLGRIIGLAAVDKTQPGAWQS